MHAQDFDGVSHFRVRERKGAAALAQMEKASDDRDAMGTTAVAAESPEEQIHHVVGDAVFQTFGLFVGHGPIQPDHVGEEFLRQAVPQGQMFGTRPATGGEFNGAVAPHAQLAVASHALEGCGHGRRSNLQILGEPGADRGGFFFLDDVPDRLQVIFLGYTRTLSLQGAPLLPAMVPPTAAKSNSPAAGAERRAGAGIGPRRKPGMSASICLLKGVNVGGHNKLPMEGLRALFKSLELRAAQTYIQSGNVVFQTNERNLARLGQRIEVAIEKKFRFRPAIVLRTSAELRQAVKRNPFTRQAGTEPGKLMVLFLADDPGKKAKEILAKIPRGPEQLHLQGREIYIFFPEGAGRSKLPWATLDQSLGTRGTGRNWNTVTRLLEMADQAEGGS